MNHNVTFLDYVNACPQGHETLYFVVVSLGAGKFTGHFYLADRSKSEYPPYLSELRGRVDDNGVWRWSFDDEHQDERGRPLVWVDALSKLRVRVDDDGVWRWSFDDEHQDERGRPLVWVDAWHEDYSD